MGRNEQSTVEKILISDTAKPIKEQYRTNSCNIISVHFLLSTPLMIFGHILKTQLLVVCIVLTVGTIIHYMGCYQLKVNASINLNLLKLLYSEKLRYTFRILYTLCKIWEPKNTFRILNTLRILYITYITYIMYIIHNVYSIHYVYYT